MKYYGMPIDSTVSVNEIITVFKYDFSEKSKLPHGDVHDFPEIIYALNNEIYLNVDGKEFVLKEGDMLIYAPNSYHIRSKPFTATALIISFTAKCNNLKAYYNKAIFLGKELKIYFIKLMEEALRIFSYSTFGTSSSPRINPSEGVTSVEVEIFKKKFEIFLLMFEKQFSNDSNSPKSKSSSEILSVIANFNANVYDNFTVSELAKLNAMSVSKLKKLFRDNLDTSPIVYFQKLKLDQAKKFLWEGEYNITEISEQLGFKTVHYFSRFFKKQVGVCPSEYIKAIKNKQYLQPAKDICIP